MKTNIIGNLVVLAGFYFCCWMLYQLWQDHKEKPGARVFAGLFWCGVGVGVWVMFGMSQGIK